MSEGGDTLTVIHNTVFEELPSSVLREQEYKYTYEDLLLVFNLHQLESLSFRARILSPITELLQMTSRGAKISMSTHPGCHPTRKRLVHSSPYKRHIPPQFRLLAPKAPSHPETPVPQLEHHNIQDEQNTATHVAGVQLQQIISQSPVASGHDFTPSPLFSPGSTVPSPERKQYEAAYPNIYTSGAGAPFALANHSPPQLVSRSLLSGVQALNSESLDLTTKQYPPYGNSQPQETIQNFQRQGYWMPTPNTPEVYLQNYPEAWAATVQPTIGVHQCQCSKLNRDYARILISF